MEKLNFREMTIEQIILSEEFKDLTVRDLVEIFRCNISADTRTGVIKLKLRCRTDDEKRFNFMNDAWAPRFNHDSPFGAQFKPIPPQSIGYIQPESNVKPPVLKVSEGVSESDSDILSSIIPEDLDCEETCASCGKCNKEDNDDNSDSNNLSDNLKDYKRKEICPNCGLYHECGNVYNDKKSSEEDAGELSGLAKLIKDVGMLSLEVIKDVLTDATESSSDGKEPSETTISPFNQIDIPELRNLLKDYYNDKISLEDIQKVWKLDDELELPVLKNLPICYGNIISLTFKIVDFDRHIRRPNGEPVNKSLVTLSTKYSVKENGVPIDLIPFIKYIEEKDGITYFTI